MLVTALVPRPEEREPFRWSHQKFVPSDSGAYVLSTASGVVLYIGLTVNLNERMGQHLENPEKTEEKSLGRASLFQWLVTRNYLAVERGWMNIHIQHEGRLPVLNKIFSPTD